MWLVRDFAIFLLIIYFITSCSDIPLPDQTGRMDLMQRLLSKQTEGHSLTDEDQQRLIELTDGIY